MTVTKTTTSEPANGLVYVLGEEIAYTITVTNDGNLTITNITVNDTKTGDSWTIPSLAPGAAQTFNTTYTVAEADILTGRVLNVATATGTSPDPDEPSVPVIPGTKEDPTETKNSHLTLEKVTTSTPANGSYYTLGEAISYSITVTNDGNMTISDITVNDELTGDSWTVESLAPGANAVFTAIHVVTGADVVAGTVKNTASVAGVDPEDDPVENKGESEDPTNTTISLTVQKVWNDAGREARPATLNMILTGGTVARYATLSAANGWTATLNNLPMYGADGAAIAYTWTEPAITGYTQTNSVTTGSTTVITNTRNAVAGVVEYPLIVHYRYLDGTQAAPDVRLTYQAGEAYDVISPVIAGYRPTEARVTGTMPRNRLELTVVYMPADTTIIEDYETALGLGQVFVNVGECVE
jgi:hypothetical protein